MRIHRLASVAIGISLLAGACAGADAASPVPDEPVDAAPDDSTGDEVAGEPGAEDGGDAEGDWADEFPSDTAREEARGFLGRFEDDLPGEVRIARRGEETFMLTEDYVLGRSTVELHDDGGGFRAVSVTVELPDGPETFELEAS